MSDARDQAIPLGRWLRTMLLLVGGAVSAVIAGRNLLWARASAGWPTATGTVSRVALAPSNDQNESYYVDVQYSYHSADGVARIGSKMRLECEPYPRKTAEAMIAGLAPGQVRTVYYDPADPDTAVLVPGAAWTEYTPLIIPALLLVLGVGLTVSLIKSQPRREAVLIDDKAPLGHAM